jgi:hypothetical protein
MKICRRCQEPCEDDLCEACEEREYYKYQEDKREDMRDETTN